MVRIINKQDANASKLGENMIRRPAKRNSDQALGFVVEGLKKTDEVGSQTYVYVMELSGPGQTVEVPIDDVLFTDGCPAIIAQE